MKFVYFGYDFMLGTVDRLLKEEHELVGVFSFPCDNIFNFNIRTVALAQRENVPLSLEKPSFTDIRNMQGKGAVVFLSAGYLFKIPDVAPGYGLNIHPSYLPKGRGLMPLPFILLDHPEAAGFTIHKLADEMDSGDILAQEKFSISEAETVETFSGRIAERAPELLSGIMKDLPSAWKNAKAQNESEALNFPPPNDQMRVLNWNLPLDRLDKIARAFGHYGSLAQIGSSIHAIYAHTIEKDKHAHPPGTIISDEHGTTKIAVHGGYFIIKKSEPVG